MGGVIGSRRNLDPFKRDLVMYADQIYWLARNNAASWELCNRPKTSPRVRRFELTAISDRMGRMRASYRRIELLQSVLGLHTAEGASYG